MSTATMQNVQSEQAARVAPDGVFRERATLFKFRYDELNRRWELLANVRLYSFLGAVVLVVAGLWRDWTPVWASGVVLFAAFFILVGLHRRVGIDRRRYLELYLINTESLHRLERNWDALPPRHLSRPVPAPPDTLDDPYAGDLDIFGHASLFRLLGAVGTFMGEQTLARWLLAPSSPEEIRSRQDAVRELAPLVDFRDELQLRGRLIGEEKPDPAPFLSWAEGGAWLAKRSWVRWFAYPSLLVFWGLAAAQLLGYVSYPWWFAVGIVNIGFSMTFGHGIHETIERATSGERTFQQYAAAFELTSDAQFKSPLMLRAQAALTGGGLPAHESLRRLHRIVTFALPDSTFMYLIVVGATLWEVHHLTVLERWQTRSGRHARQWLDTLGEVEAIGAEAGLAFSQPEWVFPDVDPEASSFEARDLGHPLLPDSIRVANDVTVGPPGSFLLVTGSNMSGKSTLLRAIGVNAVLAQAGGPVCASRLVTPPVDLWTSMRLEDSLERGVSYFMAELQRLRRIVDAAQRDRQASGRRLLYLLDEILQGTNTQERQVAARRVIMHLAAQGAIGAVSTHDLTLADAPAVAALARLVHFTETILDGPDGAEMEFDYKLRPGLATSTNALKLMEIVGLKVD